MHLWVAKENFNDGWGKKSACNNSFPGWYGNNWRIEKEKMFQGFNELTIMHFKAICGKNSK